MRDMQATRDAPLTDPEPDGGEPRPPARPGRSRRGLLAATALVVIVADLATKTWIVRDFGAGHVDTVIPGVLHILQSRNAGAAFGLAAGATIGFSLVAVVVAGVIVRASRRLRSLPWALALGLLLGGALGNLGDRLFRSPGVLRGQVVDWIDVTHWPVFNLADAGITVGGVLAVLLALRGLRLDGTREQQ